jgi:hypothetical protein
MVCHSQLFRTMREGILFAARLIAVTTCLTAVIHAQEKPASGQIVPNGKVAAVNAFFELTDGTTAYGVPGTVRLGRTDLPVENCHWTPQTPEPPQVPLQEHKTDAYGKLRVQVPSGCYSVEITAPGYKPFNALFVFIQQDNRNLRFSMGRLQEPEGARRAQASLHPGVTIYYGYVADGSRAQPIAGAEVREQLADARATTDVDGVFILEIPTKRAPDDGCSSFLDSISVKADGYEEELRKNVEIYRDEVTGGTFGLLPGTGTVADGGKDSPEPALSAGASDEMAKWWSTSSRKANVLVDEWQNRLPAIEKLIRQHKLECSDQPYTGQIVDAAKFAGGPEVALVDYCGLGAYTDNLLLVQLDGGKPILSRSGNGETLSFAQGASAMHELGVYLVPEKSAIFSVSADNDGCHLLACRAEAYVWNSANHNFDPDKELSQIGRQSYCRYAQQALARQAEKDAAAKSSSSK